jgi:phospholipid/cholesterol/gamma-HCH transport system substrate-binding protein
MTRKIEFKVGLFITVTALLIVAAIGYVAYRKGAFAKVYTYTLSSQTGESLTEGMPVVVWGFNIGRVGSLELDPQGTVLIQIKIPERHNHMIRADSRFTLEKPLIGSARIVVSAGSPGSPPLSPEAVSPMTVSNDINEIIHRAKPIIDKADRIMANVARVTENLADPEGDVNRILKNAEAVSARFAKKDSILEMAVGNPESIRSIHETLAKVRDIAVRVDGLLAKADTITGRTGDGIYGPDGVLPLVQNILHDLLAKLAKIDASLDHINRISAEAADSTKDLRVLRGELDAAVTAIGNLANELDRKIPFKARPEIRLP